MERREAAVYVVTDDGELQTADEAVAAALVKGGGAAGPVELEKASAQVRESAALRAGRWVEPRVAYDDLLAFYDWNSWHRRCCVVKAVLTAGLGWRVERGGGVVYDALTDAGDRDDPAVRLLLAPSADEPTLTFEGLLHRVLVDYEATGDGYLEVVYDRGGRVAELYHAPARTMRRGTDRHTYWQIKLGRQVPFPTFGGGVSAEQPRDEDGRFARRPAGSGSEIVHLFQYDPLGDDYGMPGWVGALASMGLDRTVLEFNTRLFQNGLMAHTAVIVQGGRLSEAGRLAVKQFVRERATGVENAGRVLLIEDENDGVSIRIEKLNLDVKDLLLTGIQNHLRDTVVASHGVPPRVLGIVTAGQLGATGEVEGQLRTFVETVLRPQQRYVEGVLGHVLERVAPGARVRFGGLDATALEADAKLLDVLLRYGALTPADAAAWAKRLRPS